MSGPCRPDEAAAQGVGLAAPQIGKSMRFAVVDVTGGKNPEGKIVLANPEVTHSEGEVREEEGCLSIPGFRGYVVRPQFVTIKAQDVKGEPFEIRGRYRASLPRHGEYASATGSRQRHGERRKFQ